MHISLIGMSNIGKSHWSRRLAKEAGYERVDCDTLVEKKLAAELTKLGYNGIHDVAKWMGQPYDPQYHYTSHRYLAYEREVMQDVFDRLQQPLDKPLVVDTTGSAIYIGDDFLALLKEMTYVVHLEAPPEHLEFLFKQYMANPKPVIWGNMFSLTDDASIEDLRKQRQAEIHARIAKRFANNNSGITTQMVSEAPDPNRDKTLKDALARCYPKLLAYRAQRYKEVAHITVPFEKHHAKNAVWSELIAE